MLCCGAVCGRGVREATMALARLLPHFQSLPPLPTSELCPFRCCPGADSRVGGLLYIIGSLGPLQRTLLRDWEFLLLPQPSQVFTVEVLRLFVSVLEPWVVWSALLPHSSSRFLFTAKVGPPGLPAASSLHVLSTQADHL